MDTLTRMRAFIDVVEAEGFSAAARKIGRSKALLSKYVRELEDELGALLLNRTTRQFSLTEAGHTYYQRASEIVREVDSLADAVRESSGDVRGRTGHALVQNHAATAQRRTWWLESAGVKSPEQSFELAPAAITEISAPLPEGAEAVTVVLSPDGFALDDRLPIVRPKPKRSSTPGPRP